MFDFRHCITKQRKLTEYNVLKIVKAPAAGFEFGSCRRIEILNIYRYVYSYKNIDVYSALTKSLNILAGFFVKICMYEYCQNKKL